MLSFSGGGLVRSYGASKGGVARPTKSLGLTYAGDAIRL
jgi:NAD(P)-dependent dehydrogenase (short-subunit alcohol dehydrogenase family)